MVCGVLPGKMVLTRIIEDNKIDAYFRSGLVKYWFALPQMVS